MSTSTTGPPRARGSLIVLVSLAVLWLVWAVWFINAPDHHADGRCVGLGFGCTPSPRDGARFVAILLLAPVSVLVAAVTVIVRTVRVSRGGGRVVWDLVLGGLLAAAVGAWLFGSVLGAL